MDGSRISGFPLQTGCVWREEHGLAPDSLRLTQTTQYKRVLRVWREIDREFVLR